MKKSLSWHLSWKVGIVQLAAFLLSITLVIWILWRPNINATPRPVADKVASAIYEENGHLRLARDRLPREYLQVEHSAWIAAVSASGDILIAGNIPVEYQRIISSIHEFDEIDIKSERLELAATGVVQTRESGKLRVLVGGLSFTGFWNVIFIIAKYITLPLLAPLMISTMLLIPMMIRRQLRGVRRVATNAAGIQLECRGKLLETEQIPSEIIPLVNSFNIALGRIWEDAAIRDRFLSDAAHELRMPIAVLRTRMSALPYDTNRVRLMSDLARMEDVAEQLLDLQRMTRRNPHRTIVLLTTLCEDVAQEVAPLVIDEGYGFEYIAPETAPAVLGDPGALSRMLKNILHNAMVHGGHRGDIVLSLANDGRISVLDNGPGIPPSEQERVFSPFYRLNPSIKGSGLGLHLAEEIALGHGGRITLSNAPAGGALFAITLPLLRTDQRE